MKKGFLVSILLLLLVGTSCEKYIDVKNSNNVAIPTTIGHLQAILDNPTAMNFQRTPMLADASSDDYFVTLPRYQGFPLAERNQALYTWRPFEYIYPNDWSAASWPIFSANFCLDYLDRVTIGQDEKSIRDNVYGSALFYRSFYFAHLAWAFAPAYDKQTATTDLGIVMRLTSNPDVPSVRTSVEDVYKQVVNDLSESVQYLPDLPEHVNRPSKSAAYALLARVYLSMRDYPSAMEAAEKSLMLKQDLMNYNDPADGITIAANSPFARYTKETIFYAEVAAGGIHFPRNDTFVDSLLVASYHPDDLRNQAFFLVVGNYKRFKGSYSRSPQFPFSGLATDELFLTLAECKVRMGDVNGGLTDLNHLLQHRWRDGAVFEPITEQDPQLALAIVLQERRKELLYRGVRWMDLKRLNKEGHQIVLKRQLGNEVFTLEPNSPQYALPLPQDILEITKIPGNIGNN
ncbi:SusD family protein [Parapedobacter composti]|uniref:SusD family protein n=1 Tax=Parapedobacter composti TaxID=623281 RepID=A0A1I1KXM0_9SPHI|nr:RagB/SusD family nutrient uptake outer membrane protein [Parapedobacter composti]SFC65567.1 SusD family protein [Parapedobacter composti]